MQPGDELVLFNGQGGEWLSQVARMGRSEVEVAVLAHVAADREVRVPVTIAVGVPANDRMDALVEKATELGVAVIQPLLCERSVFRVDGARARKKVEHWSAVAIAASEQSGRTRVPLVQPFSTLPVWLAGLAGDAHKRVLSLRSAAATDWVPAVSSSGVVLLSGPEGGLSPTEEDTAMAHGFVAASLGPRTLRADTAPLAALALITTRAVS